jgi:hypothetical protein
MRHNGWITGWLCACSIACAGSGGDDEGAAGSSGTDTGASDGSPTGDPTTMTSSVTLTDDSVGDDAPPTTTSEGSSGIVTGIDSDGGGSSSSSDSGVQPGDCSQALLCEDFESHPAGMAPGAPWIVSTSQATLDVDTTMAYSGANAVRITTEDGDGTYRRAYMSIEGAPVFPTAENVVWGRMMYHLVEWPAGPVHWTNIQGEGDVPDMDFRGLYRYGGMNDGELLANYETQGVSTDCWRGSDTVMPQGQWTCLEWHFDGNTDTMELYIDGVIIDDVTVVGMGDGCIAHDTGDNWYAPIFDTMRLGWEHYQATSAREMWIDDVALDDVRIGCPP